MTWTLGDLFCGGGGTTYGASLIPGVKVIWALNHSKSAIETHQANHPNVRHYQTDILMQDEHVFPRTNIISMSSECTNHCKAKGGRILDEGSRCLPNQLRRFVVQCKPELIFVENVEEFLKWGPLNAKGRPIKAREGEYYRAWVESIMQLGYRYDFRILDASNYGCYTSRCRYYGIFRWYDNKPINFPKPLNEPKKACRDFIDTNYVGKLHCLGETSLSVSTQKKVIAGVEEFGKDAQFLIAYYGNGRNCCSLDEPIRTITTHDRFALITMTGNGGYFYHRMLTINEYKQLQGFPEDYILKGTRAEQLKCIGNAVVPKMAQLLIETNIAPLCSCVVPQDYHGQGAILQIATN